MLALNQAKLATIYEINGKKLEKLKCCFGSVKIFSFRSDVLWQTYRKKCDLSFQVRIIRSQYPHWVPEWRPRGADWLRPPVRVHPDERAESEGRLCVPLEGAGGVRIFRCHVPGLPSGPLLRNRLHLDHIQARLVARVGSNYSSCTLKFDKNQNHFENLFKKKQFSILKI